MKQRLTTIGFLIICFYKLWSKTVKYLIEKAPTGNSLCFRDQDPMAEKHECWIFGVNWKDSVQNPISNLC